MNNIQHLSELEGAPRIIRLNSTPTISNPTPRPIDRNARELRLAAGSSASTSTEEPADLAEAIRREVQAGHGADAAERAARKYPNLARAWGERFAAARS